MAIFEDDFESYTLGQSLPFGSWTGGSVVFNGIQTGGPYPSNGKCFGLAFGTATYVNGPAFYSSLSVFFAFKVTVGNQIEIFRCDNGPNGLGNTFILFHLRIEQDGTITATIPQSGQIVGNSRDNLIKSNDWNFIQINLLLTDVTILAVNYMHMNCHIALNGKEVITRDFDTTATVASLANATAQVNKFVLISPGCNYDNFTLDTLQSIVTYPHAGTPKITANQGVTELIKLPDSALIKAYRGVTEIAKLPNSAKVIAYQGVIELLLENTIAPGLWKVKEY